ncbi:MAG: HNH endonuclease signature motif containing protein [Candidatus ainarchaeum sp.]|nr:HNH endonuclease signature motif containing protein [Candidatus ainarchaeum sp.]
MRAHEGEAPSSSSFNEELKKIENQTPSSVHLARSPDRNIVRNSGQYWKALDLIEDAHGKIQLTPFGRKVADRNITKTEFATTVIKTLELPNLRIEPSPEKWKQSGLHIKPLELILSILAELEKEKGKKQAYITPFELIRIVIPLSGENAPIRNQIEAIILHRQNRLDISNWPDCATSANDQRMAREFLLFLENYGLCNRVSGRTRLDEKYYLCSLEPDEAESLVNIKPKNSSLKMLEEVKESQIPFVAERKKVFIEIIARSQQPQFRRNVLRAYKSTCLLTEEKLSTVLEAAHIKPASLNGNDRIENGFCFRSDIHMLFDSGHIQIDPEGNIKMSESALRSRSYKDLPKQVKIPNFVSRKNLEWRWAYC